jgi:hypothetical protein
MCPCTRTWVLIARVQPASARHREAGGRTDRCAIISGRKARMVQKCARMLTWEQAARAVSASLDAHTVAGGAAR